MSLKCCRTTLALVLTLALSGCATIRPGEDEEEINQLLSARGSSAATWRADGGSVEEAATVRQWLGEPMTIERAVAVAMLRSPRLQREYARLGLIRADVLEAVQLSNPRFAVSWLRPMTGAGSQLVTSLAMPLVDLLLLPLRSRLARADHARARLDLAAAIQTVTLDVEAAWYRYVGTQQIARMRAAVSEGMATSAEMAQRFFDAGNISELQLKQEQAAASEAKIGAARAMLDVGQERLELNLAIGLGGEDAGWQTVDHLPLPATQEDDPAELARMAHENNLELLAARQELLILQDALGVSRRLRVLGGLEVGYQIEREVDGSRMMGPTLGLEIPLFNRGQARVARAEAQLLQSRAHLLEVELRADNTIRIGAENVRILSELVTTHSHALIPQREAIVARSQERQNYMLIGVFELIQAKIREYDAYQSYLESLRDYWLARVELTRAVGSRLPSDAQLSRTTIGVEQPLTPPSHHGVHP